MPSPILVVGAGIGGLTAALAFVRAGHDVDILERAPRLEAAGAGLQLSPNALRILADLDLDPADLQGVAAGQVTLRSYRNGDPIAEVPVRSRDGTAYLSLHRADLQQALLAAVTRQPRITLTLGCECIGLRRDAHGLSLAFRHPKGGAFERQASVVVAADGVGSTIAGLLGHPPARPSGDVAWRMTVDHGPTTDAPARKMHGIEAWLGPGRHAVAYPIRRGRQTNIVLIGPASETADGPADKSKILARFGGWDPRLRQMVEAAGPATAWPLSTRLPVKGAPPSAGLFLIGDAAHAMLPYAAQGAAMAIEDAWVAAQVVTSAATLTEAAARFEALRAPRIARVLKRVAFHRRVYHLPYPLSLARDLVLQRRPKAALAADLAWLYDWIPPAIPRVD